MPQSWLDRRIDIRPSPLQGRGSFALEPIAAGEVIMIWEHEILDATEAAARTTGDSVLRNDGKVVWLPPNDPSSREHFLNHSCDPNVWMADEVTLVARRNIAQGEELTTDYALFELDVDFRSSWHCQCAASACRRGFSGRDYELPELQQRVWGTLSSDAFAPHVDGPRASVSGINKQLLQTPQTLVEGAHVLRHVGIY